MVLACEAFQVPVIVIVPPVVTFAYHNSVAFALNASSEAILV